MSRPKLVAVLATLSNRRSIRDRSNRVVFLFEVGPGYSLQDAQAFFDMNSGVFGPLRARYELARFKSVRRMLLWADRARPRDPRPLVGWYGPLRLSRRT